MRGMAGPAAARGGRPGLGPALIVMAAVLAAGLAVGAGFVPGAWYAGLAKPWFTPAPWVFGPVWAVLYLLIGWAGARALRRPGLRGLWLVQMAVNLIWSPVFFGLQWPAGGLAVIAVLWLAVLAFIVRAWTRDRPAAIAFLPYLAWVTLAGAVNAGVVWLNA